MIRFEEALDRLLRLTVVLNDDMTRSLAREGLTVSRTQLLWVLRRHGEPLTHRQLADALDVTARTVTGLVDGLEADGFVVRRPHPTDRRAMLVAFTERGADLMRTMRAQQDHFARLLFEDMPADRFETFVAAMDDVLTRLESVGVPEPETEKP